MCAASFDVVAVHGLESLIIFQNFSSCAVAVRQVIFMQFIAMKMIPRSSNRTDGNFWKKQRRKV